MILSACMADLNFVVSLQAIPSALAFFRGITPGLNHSASRQPLLILEPPALASCTWAVFPLYS